MNTDKTFAAIEKLKEVELELHRLKNYAEMMDRAIAAEREACAKLMGELTCMGNAKECFEVAATYIRARGQG